MSICYIYQDQYPWDIRVEKIVSSLASNGYEMHIISMNRTGLPVEEKIGENIFVKRLPKGLGNFSRRLINFPAFFSPFWIATIFITVKKHRLKLIIVRDLPLAPAAFFVGKLLQIPVMMDMAENYPAMIQSTWRYRGPRFFDYFIRNPFLLKKMENWLLPRLDAFLVVSHASGERVKTITKVNEKPVWVVSNTPCLESSARLLPHPLVEQMRKHHGLILLYTGMVEAHRGLDTVIKAIPLVLKERINLLVVIVGRGSSESKLKSLAAELNVEQHVIFAGWVDSSFIPSIVGASDICIVPHYVTEHTDTTIPNKIFDYMAQTKPVIVTNSKTLKHIVESTNCGRIYKDDSPANLAKVIIELKCDSLRKKLGQEGYRAVQEKFNWEKDKKVLVNAVKLFFKSQLKA